MIPSDETDDRPASGDEPKPAEQDIADQPQASENVAEAIEAIPAEAEEAAAPQSAPAPASPPAPDPLEEARAAFVRTREQLLRTAADYDNFRKRSRREVDDALKQGREGLLRDLLPVFDNLERAAAHAGQATEAKAVADGVNIVLRQFLDTLGKVGIKRISAVGQPFDPMQHEAIHQVETADHPPGTVVEEVQPGYAMGDRLVRAAMVVVAKPRPVSARPPPPPERDPD